MIWGTRLSTEAWDRDLPVTCWGFLQLGWAPVSSLKASCWCSPCRELCRAACLRSNSDACISGNLPAFHVRGPCLRTIACRLSSALTWHIPPDTQACRLFGGTAGGLPKTWPALVLMLRGVGPVISMVTFKWCPNSEGFTQILGKIYLWASEHSYVSFPSRCQ